MRRWTPWQYELYSLRISPSLERNSLVKIPPNGRNGRLLVWLYNLEYVAQGSLRDIYHSGDDCKEDPPVPIPNTEVKLFNAESTWG